jgi:DNA polymerase-4
VFLAPRFDLYQDASRDVMRILRSYTPLVEPISLDEAFLDVEGARRLHGEGPEIARSIRAQVLAETELTASVGAATTKLLAKLASDLSKPDGLLVVAPGAELEFLHPLDVGRLWGVGPATRRRLEPLGVRTVGDLAATAEDTLISRLGQAAGRHLHALAWNRDERPVVSEQVAKSMGHEQTFPTDVTDRTALEQEIGRLADPVASRLRAAARVARTVQLKVRYADFRTITRSRTLATPTDLAAELASVARELFAAVPIGTGIRLLGISAQQLEDAEAGIQAPLFGDDPPELAVDDGARSTSPGPGRQAAVERSIDAVRARFGQRAVGAGVPHTLEQEGTKRPAR